MAKRIHGNRRCALFKVNKSVIMSDNVHSLNSIKYSLFAFHKEIRRLLLWQRRRKHKHLPFGAENYVM